MTDNLTPEQQESYQSLTRQIAVDLRTLSKRSVVQKLVKAGECPSEDAALKIVNDVEKSGLNLPLNTSSRRKSSIFSFSGRINRGTYWLTIISLLLVNLVVSYILIQSAGRGGSDGIMVLGIIIGIPTIWIALATYVKRFHDLGSSGWMVLTLFIPYANFLIAIILGLWPGKGENNKYGEVP